MLKVMAVTTTRNQPITATIMRFSTITIITTITATATIIAARPIGTITAAALPAWTSRG